MLATVDPSVSVADSTKIVEAASSDNRASLERVVKTLALVFGTTVPAPVESRDLLFSHIKEIKDALSAAGNAGSHDIVLLSDKTAAQIVSLAQDDISVRYALKQLDSFALSGNDELFVQFDADGELDLVGDDAPDGTLTREWITDRAELLLAQCFVNTFEDGSTIHGQFFTGKDLVLVQPGLDPQTIRIVGAEGVKPPIDTPQIVFGSEQGDTLRGLDAADHLYGELGNDHISGGKGADYIEGGTGNDDLQGELGDDCLVGGAGEDTLDGGPGNNRLEGGAGIDTYIVHRGVGNQVITDSDGLGQILLDGAALHGGHGVRPGQYEDDAGHTYTYAGSAGGPGALIVDDAIEITNFHSGDLGITLGAGMLPEDPPAAGGARLYLDNIFDMENRDTPGRPAGAHRFPHGSPDDDTYIAGSEYVPFFLGRAGNDRVVGYGATPATLLGGAGDDLIENRDTPLVPINPRNYPIVLAGEGGRDWLIGSANDETLFGDFYKIVFPATTTYRIDIDAIQIYGDAETYATSYYPTPYANNYPGEFRDLRIDYAGGIAQALADFVGYSLADLPADAFDDTIDAGARDDFAVGGPGDDIVLGGEGNDQLFGDSSFDNPSHSVRMETGNPRFVQYNGFFGQPGDDYIDGGPGDDLIQDIGGFTSTALGGPGDDHIFVVLDDDPESDRDRVAFLDGGDGDDVLDAQAPFGAIMIDGGAGNDTIGSIGDLAYLDGGTGSDDYDVRGLDITIHDDDGTDTLILHAARDEFNFSQEGDDLVIVSWYDLGDEDRVGPDGEAWALATLVIEDWFADPSHQIEQIMLVPDAGEETEWTPDDIAAAIGAGGLAWSDFTEPELQAFTPFELPLPAAPPPDSTSDPPSEPPPHPDPDPEPDPDPDPMPHPNPEPEPDPEPEPEPEPPPAIPPETTATPVRIAITDPDYHGILAGTAFADEFTVMSERGVLIDAGAGDDRITTGGGSDEIRTGPGSDIVSAGGGDDRIIVDRFEGDKRIDGGSGIDILSIDRSVGSISGRLEDGRIVITDGEGSSLSAANVNIYEFADALYVQAGSQSEAVVAWMYKTWLAHTPDAPGMQFWLDQVTTSHPLADIERIFVAAMRSTSLFTGTDDEEFLDGLAARAIGRAIDPADRAFWLQQLQTGSLTRDEAITGLVAYEEAQVEIAGVILVPGTL